MIDQIIIGGIGSYDEYEASVAEREKREPKKKSIKETVPFSNVTHDFSAINGEVYWEERELEYIFEITADSPEELEEKKRPFLSWIMNVMNAELYDPFIRDYHFLATYDDIDVDDSEFEKSTIAVTFTAYPYMIANEQELYEYDLTSGADWVEAVIVNNSSHRITPTFSTDVPVSVKMGDSTYSIAAGETKDDSFKFAVGNNTVYLKTTGGSGTLMISFYREVF